MKVRRILSMLLAIAVVMAVFTACGSNNEKPTAATTTATQASDSTTASEPAKEEPITFTAYFNQADEGWDKSQIAKYVAEKTGVSLQIEYLVGDEQAKASIMIASGEYPDLLWGGGPQDKYVTGKTFIPLNNYIDKSENLKKMYDGCLGMMKKDDGNIYYIYWDRGNMTKGVESSGIYVQRAVLKDAGYPKITTFQQYIDLIQKYKEKNPTINDKKTIGMSFLTTQGREFNIFNSPALMTGYPNDGNVIVNPQTYEAKTFALTPEAKTYNKMLNDAYLKGLFDPESFTQSPDQWIAKCSTGAVLGFGYAQNWEVGEVQSALRNQKMDDRVFVALPVVLSEGIKDQYQWPGNPIVRDGIGITVSCKNPDRAFKFLDYMASEEIQKLLHWGFKDQDYSVDDKGRMYQTPEQVALSKDNEHRKQVGNKIVPWPSAKNTALYSDGNSWDPAAQNEVIQAGYDDYDKEVLNAYGAKVYSDMFNPPIDSPYGVAWDIPMVDGSPEQLASQNLLQVQKEYVAKLVIAKEGQFDNIWSQYEAKVNGLNLKIYEDYLTKALQARAKQWAGK